MTAPALTLITAEQHPELLAAHDEATNIVWPEFMLHDAVANLLWYQLYKLFPAFQFALVDADGALIVGGNSIPLAWEGTASDLPDGGWDWALQKGFDDQAAGHTPTVLCALSITIAPGWQGKGLSTEALHTMRGIGRAHNLTTLIAPVRPTLKTRYPLTPMARYIHWRRADGEHFDPWLRVHERAGGQIVAPCTQSMRIEGTVAEWEDWAEMAFPRSDRYVVPGALAPVEIDRAADRGVYVEPNVWVNHSLTEG